MDDRNPARDGADWPYGSLLFFGFFGTSSPGGRRLVWQTTIALVVIVVAAWALQGIVPPVLPAFVWAIAIPAGVAMIAWAIARYLSNLDELSRAIQLQAFAAAYGAAMIIAAAVVGYLLAIPPEAARAPHPVNYVALIVLAEILRGVALVIFAKRYQ